MTTALLSRRVGPVPLQRLLRVGLAGLPVIFAVPILVALVQGIANIVAQGHPFFGDISGTATDARAITLGSPLYQDPAAGYTPLVYPPVMTLLSAGLDELKAWDGWTVILSIAADVTLIAVGTRLALGSLRGTAVERTAAVAGAVGIGAMAFWLMAFVPFNFAYSPRPDQLAWAFALVGLVLLPGAAGGSLTLLVSGANGAIAIAQLPPLWALIWAGECGASTAYQAFCAVLDGEVRFEQAHAQLVLLQGDGLGWDAGAPYVFENRSLVGASLLVSMASAVDLSRVMRVVAPTEQVVQLGATTARASAPVSGEGPLRLVAMRAERRSRAGGQR